MPSFSFPSVGRLGLASPPSRPLSYCLGLRYYDPLRLPLHLPGSLRSALASRYLACLPWFVSRTADGDLLSTPSLLLFRLLLSDALSRGVDGPLEFPGFPFVHMPRSQSPVVSCRLPCHGLDACLPEAQTCRLSPLPQWVIHAFPMDHNYTIFGDQSRGLRTHYTGLYTSPLGDAYRFISVRVAMPDWWDLFAFARSPTGKLHLISQTPFRSRRSEFNSTR